MIFKILKSIIILILLSSCSKTTKVPFDSAKETLGKLLSINKYSKNDKPNSDAKPGYTSKVFKSKFFIKEDSKDIYQVVSGMSYNIWANGRLKIEVTLFNLKNNKTKLSVKYSDFGYLFFIPMFYNPGLIKEKKFINEFIKESNESVHRIR
jgi:hypothetical protein